MKKTTLAIFCLSLGCGFQACSQSEGGDNGSNPVVPSAPRLADELPGSWKADSTVTLKSGALALPASVTMNVVIASSQTFSGTIDASTALGAIDGHLFSETGTWVAKSADTVVLRPANCLAADTATTTIMNMPLSLPFKQSGTKYVANALATSACPDSVVITNHPVHDTLHLTMPVTVPLQGKAIWTLTFKKQP